MHRFKPSYDMYAPIKDYPAKTNQTAAIMLMIQNNLDQRWRNTRELITYGGNAPAPNWAQYL